MIVRLLVLFTAIALCYADFEGYKVFRLLNLTTPQLQNAMGVAEKNYFDVWAANAVEGWMDVMVPPNAENLYSGYEKELRFDDIDRLFNESKLPNPNPDPMADPIFNSFPTWAQINAFLDRQIAQNPNRIRSVNVGPTYLNNNIRSVVISTDTGRPQVLIQCCIHAREWITPPTCLWIIDQLLNNPERVRLLNAYEWHIIPVVNVDGYIYSHSTASGARNWRKSRQPNPSSNCIGTDINRNYPFQWGLSEGASHDPCSETFCGSAKASTPEMQQILKYITSLTRRKIFFDIHSYAGLFMSPWGYTKSVPSAYPTMEKYMKPSVDAIKAVNNANYNYGQGSIVLYIVSGGSRDYWYGEYNQPISFTIEAFGSSFAPPASDILRRAPEITAGVFETATLALSGQ